MRRHIVEECRDCEERVHQDLEALQKDGVKVVWPRTCKEKTHECPRPVIAAARSIGKESRELQDDQDLLQVSKLPGRAAVSRLSFHSDVYRYGLGSLLLELKSKDGKYLGKGSYGPYEDPKARGNQVLGGGLPG